ncbi:hypothetical protein K1719_023374 [Acacia pycnantha]|nr:hypothetical protein K1719_023374 [Acacia pycnantha]
MLQKVKEEEKLRLACGSPGFSYGNLDSQCSAADLPVMDGITQCDAFFQEVIPSSAPSLNNSHSNQSQNIGEICLDKLSIRELHELFKVTFGQETTVKDK